MITRFTSSILPSKVRNTPSLHSAYSHVTRSIDREYTGQWDGGLYCGLYLPLSSGVKWPIKYDVMHTTSKAYHMPGVPIIHAILPYSPHSYRTLPSSPEHTRNSVLSRIRRPVFGDNLVLGHQSMTLLTFLRWKRDSQNWKVNNLNWSITNTVENKRKLCTYNIVRVNSDEAIITHSTTHTVS